MIRIPENQSLQVTPIGAPMVSEKAAAAPAQALGNVASAIAGVSDEFHDAARKVQLMENGRIVSEKRQALASNYAQLQIDLQKDPDPASRIQKTKDFFGTAKGEMDSEELPPAIRSELLGHFDAFATNAMIQQGEDAFRMAKTRGLKALDNELATMRNAGVPDPSLPLKTAVESGFILPEDVDRIRTEYVKDYKVQEMTKTIQAKPLESEQALNDPKFHELHPELDPQTIDRLRNEAERTANKFRSDFQNDIIISGVTPKPEELDAMEKSGQIDKATHARWLTQIRSDTDPPFDPALYEEKYGQIVGYDPSKDSSGRTEAQLRAAIASEHLPTAAKKTLNDKLNEIISGGGPKTPKGKLESEFASRIESDFHQGQFGKYRFPVDHDNNPSTPPIMSINSEEWTKSWQLRGQFAEQWRGIMANMPSNATFEQVNGAYKELQRSFKDKKPTPVLNFSEISKPDTMPFNPDSIYQKAKSSKFGGIPVRNAGDTYMEAIPTVFGGKNDPVDNGQSAFGGRTGDGAKQGTAIPEQLLVQKFPGKDKQWIADNVRTVVRGPDGRMHIFPVVDLGTAEQVWERNQRPTLDLTEGAARQIGARPTYENGKIKGVTGVSTVDFSVVSIDVGKPLKGMTWEQAKTAWFNTNRPRSNEQASNGLIALREAWHMANADFSTSQASDALLPPRRR